MKKSIICLLLAFMMVAGLLVGCGKKTVDSSYKDDESQKVTLTMAIPKAKQADADKVLQEVNKKLEGLLPNTELEILWESDMTTKWTLWMAAKKKIDIAHSGYVTDLEEEVAKKSYIALDNLIDEYAPTLKEDQEKYWSSYNTGIVADELYAIPNVQYHIKDIKIIKLESLKPYTDLVALKEEAWATDTTTEKFWQILDEALDKAAKAGEDVKGKVGLPWYNIAKKGYVFIGGEDSNLCYLSTDAKCEIIDFYTTDAFKVFCSYMKKWYDKGYVSPDVHAVGLNAFGATSTSSMTLDRETGMVNDMSGNPFAYTNPDNTILTTNIGGEGTYWSIPYTSENPVRAIKFIDLLHSEKGAEIANLLAYGFEGTHYEVTDAENGNIQAFEYQGQGGSNVSYGVPSWIVSNMLRGLYNIAPYNHENKEFAVNYHAERVNKFEKHPLYGTTFDTSAIKSKLSNIIKNNSELASNIYTGISKNSDAMLEELMAKNKAAGIEEVIKELQKQANENAK